LACNLTHNRQGWEVYFFTTFFYLKNNISYTNKIINDMRNSNERTGSTNMDSKNNDYKRSSRNFQNSANPSDNPKTGIDDDDNYNVEDIDAYEYENDVDDDQVVSRNNEYEDVDHEHTYSVPLAENDEDEDYYHNENRPQDERF
jgi:hypothetical protein